MFYPHPDNLRNLTLIEQTQNSPGREDGKWMDVSDQFTTGKDEMYDQIL
jgi:hypothetical protein